MRVPVDVALLEEAQRLHRTLGVESPCCYQPTQRTHHLDVEEVWGMDILPGEALDYRMPPVDGVDER